MTPYEALYRTAVVRKQKREQEKADPHLARALRKAYTAAERPSNYDDPVVTVRASDLEALAFAALGLEDR